jgi:hypothetical protein
VIIIGITGKKGSGKDTVADFIANEVPTRFYNRKTPIAEKMKEIARTIWDLSYAQIRDPALKEVVDPRWGLSPRQIMQTFGTDVGRAIHPDTWIRHCLREISHTNRIYPGSHFTIPDVRFLNEAKALREYSEPGVQTILVRVIRPDLKSEDTHSSEQEMDLIEVDYTIVNNGTLEDLRVKTLAFWALAFGED